MPRDDMICFLDLETTGSDIRDHVPIEVGMIITTATPELEIIRELSKTHRPAYWDVIFKPRMEQVVIDMHTKNGLLAEIDALENRSYAYKSYEALEQEMLDFLGKGTEHIPLAGSGVGHFDRPYIKRFFPRVDQRFTYWNYDIGVIRRMLQLAGNQAPTKQEGKTHRAVEDVRGDIEATRKYLKFFGGWGAFEQGEQIIGTIQNSTRLL